MLHINLFVENVGVNMASKKRIHFPTKEEIEKMREQDAERCKNYLTAKDFYEKYGDNENEYLVYLSRSDIIRVENLLR